MSVELKYPVITIGREYCAYGRTIAQALSERLGIPYYDKDFVQKTVQESGFTEEEVLAEGENMSGFSAFLDELIGSTAGYSSSYDRIFKSQSEIILELAKEPCIIVGRCADHILKDSGVKAFNVFLFADLEYKMKRAAELHPGKTEEQLEKIVKKTDELRKTYYKHFTGEDIRFFNNYDVCLDTGIIGVDECIDVLEKLIKK